MKNKTINNIKVIIGIFIVCMSILMYLVPFMGDDWAWGSQIGLDRLNSLFKNYNGRWAGNLLILVLSRSKIAASLIRAITFFIVIELCVKYTGCPDDKKIVLYTAAFSFFLMQPNTILRQGVFWTSGFANYVPPVAITLFFIISVIHNYPDKSEWIFLPLSFIGALFMENISIFNVVLSFFLLIYHLIRSHKIDKKSLLFLIGTLLGCVLLFYEGIRYNNGYRHVATDWIMIISTAWSHIQVFIEHSILRNIPICCFVSLITLVKLFYVEKNKKIIPVLFSLIHLIDLVYLAYKYITHHFQRTNLTIMVSIVYIVTLYVIAYLGCKKGEYVIVLSPLFCIPIIMGPLLVVDPVGPRNCFSVEILLLLYVLSLINFILDNPEVDAKKKAIGTIFSVLFAAYYCYLFTIYYPIYQVDTIRNKLAIEQSKAQLASIFISKLPNSA